MSSLGSCDHSIIEFKRSYFGTKISYQGLLFGLWWALVYGSHKYFNNTFFSKNRANLIETGKVVFCHGFMAAQAICILTIIFISLNATVSETGPIMVEQRFNSTRLS